MLFLKQYKFEIVVFCFITVLFFFSRLVSLLSVPIFTDEALYLRWAQIAKNDAAWRFISLTDGKQPLFIWLVMIAMRFIEDPLMAGRIVSVLAGFTTMLGLFFLSKEVFRNHWIGIISSFLYVIYPFALVYDRMALYDSLVGTFSVWSLYVSILLVRRLRLDLALILGMVIGAGVINKTSGFFNLYLLPLTLILFDLKKKERYIRFAKWVGLALVVAVLTYAYYSILRLSPFFHYIDQKNATFVYPLRDWLDHPLNFFISNWKGLFNWFILYMTWPMLVVIASSFFIDRKYLKEKILLFLWFIVPFVALAIFGRNMYPRFIFFMTLSLLPLAALVLYKLKGLITRTWLLIICLLLFILLQLRSDYFILADFVNAPIPQSDLGQYISDWPAGGGVKEAVSFFREKAKKEKIYIGTQGTFGLMPYALEIYLVDNPNIKIVGFWPIGENPPKKLTDQSRIMPTFIVFYQPCDFCEKVGLAPKSWPLTLVAKYEKPAPAVFFSIYQVNSR